MNTVSNTDRKYTSLRHQPAKAKPGKLLACLLAVLLITPGPRSYADTVNVAVSSNFSAVFRLLKTEYEQGSDHQINLITGSSGKHYAQIVNGAPYDLFLSADEEQVNLLKIHENMELYSSQTYAIGRLALWSRQAGITLNEDYLQNTDNFRRLATANPDLAPYGRAALQTLNSLGLTDSVADRMVYGENISQAFQFAYSGNAQLGLLAYSQVLLLAVSGSYWLIPQSFHEPIRQDMALLRNTVAARSVFQFLSSDAARRIISTSGYSAPDPGS